LNPILFFPGTEHGMIQGNKACSIGPAQGEHPEPVEKPAAAMVMDPGKKLDAPGTIPVINGCVHYEHLLSCLIRQRFEEGVYYHLDQKSQQTSPIAAWRGQKPVDRILSHQGCTARMNTRVNVPTNESKLKNRPDHASRTDSTHLPHSGKVQESCDLEPGHKLIDATLNVLIRNLSTGRCH
jgi:hypothetical protein